MRKTIPQKIAFVLDIKASPQDPIRYILTSISGRRDWWKVWKPQYEGHRGKDRSVRQYAQALFVVFAHAAADQDSPPRRGHPARKRKQPPIPYIASRNDKYIGCWAKLLYDRIQDATKYEEIPAAVRKNLSPLLEARSKRGKDGHARIEIAKNDTENVLFWNATSKILETKDLEGYAKAGTPVFVRTQEPSSIDIGVAYALSKRIPSLGRRETWQDLYRRSAIDLEYAASDGWIETTVKPLELTPIRDNSSSQEGVTLRQILSLYDNILLAGVSGSGKTIALRRLCNTFCTEDSLVGEQSLPVYIKLKEFEPVLIHSLENYGAVHIAELVGKAISATICNKSRIQELLNSKIVLALIREWCNTNDLAQLSREHILRALSRKVALWFENEGMKCPHVLLFLDGINELQPNLREALKEAVSPLLKKECKCKVVISCRSNLIVQSIPEPCELMCAFELQPPTEHDIISYIDYFIPGRGNELFATRIRVESKVLSLAKNLFFLAQFVQTLMKDVNVRLSFVKGNVVQRFVLACIRKKEKETGMVSEQKSQALLFSVLPHVARWAIETTTLPTAKAPSPSVFSDRFVGSHFLVTEVEETLEFAESCGLLTASGMLVEERSRFGNPIFIHEFVRDYFAAHYLFLQQRLARVPYLENILEYLEWDSALEMYFGLVRDTVRLQEDIAALSEWDLFMASRCLACCPVADESCAQELLRKFSSPRFQQLYRDNEFPPEPFDIRTALSHVFSILDPKTLSVIYLDTSNYSHLRDAIPAALLLALGQGAFPYLKEFIDRLDFLDCEPAYMAVQKLATWPAWELLTTKYIEFAQYPADNKHMVVQIMTFGLFVGVTPELVLKQVGRARREMRATGCPEILVDRIVRSISMAFQHMAPEYTNDLVKLEDHPDKVVSEQASEALLRIKHPLAIHATLKRVRHAQEFPPPMLGQLSRDLGTLCELNDPDVDAKLWQLFENSLVPHSSHEWSHIPYELAPRTDRSTLERLIRRSLSLNSWNALESMKGFVRRVPDVVLPILREQAPKAPQGTSLWHRLVAFRAGCGDTSVKTELLRMLADIENIHWVTDIRDMLDQLEAPLVNSAFRAFVIDVVDKLRILEALPILKKIAEKKEMHRASAYARNILIEDIYRQVPKRSRVTAMVETMVATYNKADKPIYDWYKLEQSAVTWPPHITENFLHQLRDRVELAIRRKNSPVVRLYTFIALVRDELRRRHLELFKNWPCSPPQGNKGSSSRRDKQTGLSRPTRRKRS